MKKLIMMAIAAIAIAACTTQKQAEPEKTVAQQLMERLDTLRNKGYMFGHVIHSQVRTDTQRYEA